MEICDIGLDDHRLADVLGVLIELRPGLTLEEFDAIYHEGYPQGLRYVAAYDGGRCVGVAGWRIHALTAHPPRKLYVDDLVTTSAARSTGVGQALLAHLEKEARAAGCAALDLDSGVQRFEAHRFYLRERMHITGHHFTKSL